jgi:hypothetical protein
MQLWGVPEQRTVGPSRPAVTGETTMVMRWCGHCESEIEVSEDARVICPVCGLDPSVAPLAFEDAPAFFLAELDLEPVRLTA